MNRSAVNLGVYYILLLALYWCSET